MISTHILDLNLGVPAAAVSVELETRIGSQWKLLKKEQTNADGRIQFDVPATSGTYRLNFQIEAYYKSKNITPFFIDAPVTFQLDGSREKYHIPLLLSSYGYSTYRGS